jgi:LPXTG-site transpeptidase (sortase) family protein
LAVLTGGRHQVGVEADGWAEIPDDVARVGWYRFGSAPGASSGSAVIVGHRDGWNEGAGALYDLAQVEPGDTIEVEREDGSTVAYTVVSREAIDKSDLPTEELFSEVGDPRLTLISCIGYFDRDNGGYLQNIVVTAIPQVASPSVAVGP